MTDTSDIILYQYGSDTAPTASGLGEVTNPLHPARRIQSRLAHFDSASYDLSPESHLSKLLKVLLGDAGVGQLHKRLILARIQSAIGGTHFYDLDAFYGGLLGLVRRSSEVLPKDPYREDLSEVEWDAIRVKDASYRSRIEQFAKAINLGSTALGLEVAAEAILNVDCDVQETWTEDDALSSTWASVESIGTYATMQGYTYAQLEQYGGLTGLTSPVKNRHKIVVHAKRILTEEERFDALRVLERLRPAGSIVEIVSAPEVVYQRVGNVNVTADSEYWEVRQRVANASVSGQVLYGDQTGFVAPPITPWSGYQGEAWSYLGDGLAVVAFTKDGAPTTSSRYDSGAQDLVSQQQVVGDATVTMLPQYALTTINSVMAGRAVSEGVLVTNPYDGTRSLGINAKSSLNLGVANLSSKPGKLKVDGADLSAVQEVAPFNAFTTGNAARLWATPSRHWCASEADCLEVRFPTQQYVNYMTLKISKVPHRLTIQGWDATNGEWVELYARTQRISSPRAFTPRPFDTDRLAFSFAPIYTNVIRIVIQRFGEPGSLAHLVSLPHLQNGTDVLAKVDSLPYYLPTPPSGFTTQEGVLAFYNGVAGARQQFSSVDALANSCCTPPLRRAPGKSSIERTSNYSAYPVTLQDTDIGYRIGSLYDLPTSVADQNEPIAVTQNLFGQSVRQMLITYPAVNTLDDTESYWKSNPQPSPNAVICLYMDVRDELGAGRVIDAFEVDPVVSGPVVNLYWASVDDITSGVNYATAVPSSLPILPSKVAGHVEANRVTGLSFPKDDIAYLDLPNTELRFSPTAQSWWVGFELVTRKASDEFVGDKAILFSVETYGSPIKDEVNLYFAPDTLTIEHRQFVTSTNSVSQDVSLSFAANERILVWAKLDYSQAGQLNISVAASTTNDGELYGENSISVAASSALGSKIRLGYTARENPGNYEPVAMTIRRMVVSYSDTTHNEFFANPEQYTRVVTERDEFAAGRNSLSTLAGSLVRMDESHISSSTYETGDLVNPWGFIGGAPDIYDDVEWNPVPREYTLSKGIMRVPSVNAAVWKLEFTSLTGEPTETFLSTPRLTKFMPANSTAKADTIAGQWTPEQTTEMELLDDVARFSEQTPYRSYIDPYYDKYRPTGGLVSPDAIINSNTGVRRGYGFNLLEWQPGAVVPMFHQRGRHDYVYQWITNQNKIGFFVGLKTLHALQRSGEVTGDRSAIVDRFDDLRGVETIDLNFDPGVIYSDDASSPILLGSPESATGKTVNTRSPIAAIQFATQQNDPFQVAPDDTFASPALHSSTFTDTTSWHKIGDSYVWWNAEDSTVRVTRSPEVAVIGSGLFDPINKQPESPILSSRPANAPSMVSGTWGGISSGLIEVSPKGVLHAACRVMTSLELVDPLTLQIIGSDETTVLAEVDFTPSPNVVTEQTLQYILSTHTSVDNSVYVRVIQSGATLGTWTMYALSLFDDGCLWEFSNNAGATWIPAYDIRNNSNGVLRFAAPGTALKWRYTVYRRNSVLSSLQIRPWYTNKPVGRGIYPHSGPNASTFDAEPPVGQDPEFTAWPFPIPQRWYALYAKLFSIETERLYGSSTFAEYFSRGVTESLSGMTDEAAVTAFGAYRPTSEVVDVPADTSTSVVAYKRYPSEDVTVTDSAGAGIFSDSLINPIVDEVP